MKLQATRVGGMIRVHELDFHGEPKRNHVTVFEDGTTQLSMRAFLGAHNDDPWLKKQQGNMEAVGKIRRRIEDTLRKMDSSIYEEFFYSLANLLGVKTRVE